MQHCCLHFSLLKARELGSQLLIASRIVVFHVSFPPLKDSWRSI
ncbi:hypothetical protein LINPERHAP2_LOCUS17634 [Linum perenne]